MRNILSIPSLVALLTVGCNSSSSSSSTAPPSHARARSAHAAPTARRSAPSPVAARPAPAARARHRYIVPRKDAAKYYVGHYQSAPAYFTPTVAEVNAFEAALPGFLKKAPHGAAVAAKLGTYRRHFVGTVIDGKRLVFGNFFCANFGKQARDVVMVDDGGDCFFNLFYDRASGTFSKLFINGNG